MGSESDWYFYHCGDIVVMEVAGPWYLHLHLVALGFIPIPFIPFHGKTYKVGYTIVVCITHGWVIPIVVSIPTVYSVACLLFSDSIFLLVLGIISFFLFWPLNSSNSALDVPLWSYIVSRSQLITADLVWLLPDCPFSIDCLHSVESWPWQLQCENLKGTKTYNFKGNLSLTLDSNFGVYRYDDGTILGENVCLCICVCAISESVQCWTAHAEVALHHLALWHLIFLYKVKLIDSFTCHIPSRVALSICPLQYWQSHQR